MTFTPMSLVPARLSILAIAVVVPEVFVVFVDGAMLALLYVVGGGVIVKFSSTFGITRHLLSYTVAVTRCVVSTVPDELAESMIREIGPLTNVTLTVAFVAFGACVVMFAAVQISHELMFTTAIPEALV
jgi:hypothetical protein